jgi:hypothetical protein
MCEAPDLSGAFFCLVPQVRVRPLDANLVDFYNVQKFSR